MSLVTCRPFDPSSDINLGVEISKPCESSLFAFDWPRSEIVDGGISEGVAIAIIKSLLGFANIAFLVVLDELISEPPKQGLKHIPIKSSNYFKSLLGRFPKLPPTTALLVATQPEMAKQLFESGTFSWSLQSQIALLLSKNAPLNTLTQADVESLMSTQWCEKVESMYADGVIGALKPGTDGAVAVLMLKNSTVANFPATLAASSSQ